MMDFTCQLQALAARAAKQLDCITTEEATKTALVMPFINALGYNVFDPTEVIAGLMPGAGTDDAGKIDFAVLRDGKSIVVFNCYPCTRGLDDGDTTRLSRHFSIMGARIGVLTNGVVYRFFADRQEPNKMDQKPFLELDLMNLQEPAISEAKKLAKSGFDRLCSDWLEERVDRLQAQVQMLQERAAELEARVTQLTNQEPVRTIEVPGTDDHRFDELRQMAEKILERFKELEWKVTDDLSLFDLALVESSRTERAVDLLRQTVNELDQRVETIQHRENELEWKMTESRLKRSFDFIEPVPNTIQFLRRGCCSIQLEQVSYESGGLRLTGYIGNPTSVHLLSVRLKFSARKWASSVDYAHFQSKGLPFLWTPQEIGSARTPAIEFIPPGERRRFEVMIPNVRKTKEGFQLYVSLVGEHYSWGRSTEQRPTTGDENCLPAAILGSVESVRLAKSLDECTKAITIERSLPQALVVPFQRMWTDREREILSKRFPRCA